MDQYAVMTPWIDWRDPGVRAGIDRYLDLMRRVLLRLDFDEPYQRFRVRRDDPDLQKWEDERARLAQHGIELAKRVKVDPEKRRLGEYWPADAESMIGDLRMRNVMACVRGVIEDGVPGDLLEAGV